MRALRRWCPGFFREEPENALYVAHRLAGVAQIAGEQLLRRQPGQIRSRQKACGDWVTSADEYSHRLLRELLTDCFPGVPLILEEQDNAPVVPATCVVADELDGTHAYMNGRREWGITLAYLERGRPAAGVLFQPATGVMIRSARNNGTWLDGQRLRFDGSASLNGRLIGGEINRHLQWQEYLWLGVVAKHCAGVRSLATTVGNAIELLSGGTVLLLNPRGGKIWDFAAAALAVEEAGGAARSSTGEPLSWSAIEMGVLFAAEASIVSRTLSLRHELERIADVAGRV